MLQNKKCKGYIIKLYNKMVAINKSMIILLKNYYTFIMPK